MNMQEVKAVAKERGVKVGSMKKNDLIRAVQEAEGNEKCYASGIANVCGQENCLWKDDCN
jgi:hypothetical protein